MLTTDSSSRGNLLNPPLYSSSILLISMFIQVSGGVQSQWKNRNQEQASVKIELRNGNGISDGAPWDLIADLWIPYSNENCAYRFYCTTQ